MSDKYTPTTEHVRWTFAYAGSIHVDAADSTFEQFDRWLADYAASVRAQVVAEQAGIPTEPGLYVDRWGAVWRISREGGPLQVLDSYEYGTPDAATRVPFARLVRDIKG